MTIPPTSSSSNAPTTTVSNPQSTLNSSDFVQMMLTELQNQDPLNPTDSQSLLSQMSSIGQLQSADQLQTTLTQFSVQNQIAAAGNLIGKTVTGLNTNNVTTQGVVTGVSAIQNQVYLQLDNGDSVQMSNVSSITGTAATPTTTALNQAPLATPATNQSNAAALLQQLLGAA